MSIETPQFLPVFATHAESRLDVLERVKAMILTGWIPQGVLLADGSETYVQDPAAVQIDPYLAICRAGVDRRDPWAWQVEMLLNSLVPIDFVGFRGWLKYGEQTKERMLAMLEQLIDAEKEGICDFQQHPLLTPAGINPGSQFRTLPSSDASKTELKSIPSSFPNAGRNTPITLFGRRTKR